MSPNTQVWALQQQWCDSHQPPPLLVRLGEGGAHLHRGGLQGVNPSGLVGAHRPQQMNHILYCSGGFPEPSGTIIWEVQVGFSGVVVVNIRYPDLHPRVSTVH